MNEYNKTYQRHSYWEQYYFCKGNYINDERDGLWEWYEYDGKLTYKEFYL